MSGVVEGKGLVWTQSMVKGYHLDITDRGCIDGHCSCLGGWVRFLADRVSIE
jgi:hypothetical protein